MRLTNSNVAIFFVFGFLYSTPVSASENEALPRLPVDEFPLIPDNAGMRFFEGVWQSQGRNSYIITKTVTVADKTFSRDDIDEVKPYRVLAKQENFVLLATYDRLFAAGSVTEYVYWTRFVILYLRFFNATRIGHPKQADMVYKYCSDDRLKIGEKGFRLPKATLLSIFATSNCRRGISASKPPQNLSFAK